MASALFAILALALAANAQYYQQQPQGYYSYPPPAQPSSRADYGRAIGNSQRPYPQTFYPQPPPPPPAYAPLTVGQQRPEGIQIAPVPVVYGLHNDLIESIFRPAVSEQHRYLTPPTLKFKIGVVSNQGANAKKTNRDEETGNFKAYLLEGYLQIQRNKENPETPNITLEFDEEKDLHKLESGINFGNKGFELSTLNVFNGKLYACDDSATGVLYEIKKMEDEDKDEDADYVDTQTQSPSADKLPSNQDKSDKDAEKKEKKATYVAQPWIILANDGQNKGFKCEWGVVKDDKLWIGSTGSLVPKGKEDEETTDFSNERQFVKVIDAQGGVTSLDWSKNYEKIAEAYEVNLKQGHVVHEAAAWSDVLNKWVFIPRRVTKEKRDEATWNKISTNEGILSDDQFAGSIKTQKFGNLTESAGVVGLRFIPGTQDQFILALKAGEDTEGHLFSTLSVLDLQGKEVMPETRVGESTFYAAVEFL